jgi:hypothetical protein
MNTQDVFCKEQMQKWINGWETSIHRSELSIEGCKDQIEILKEQIEAEEKGKAATILLKNIISDWLKGKENGASHES